MLYRITTQQSFSTTITRDRTSVLQIFEEVAWKSGETGRIASFRLGYMKRTEDVVSAGPSKSLRMNIAALRQGKCLPKIRKFM